MDVQGFSLYQLQKYKVGTFLIVQDPRCKNSCLNKLLHNLRLYASFNNV